MSSWVRKFVRSGFVIMFLVSCILLQSAEAKEAKQGGFSDLAEGDRLFSSGQYEAAAKWYVNFAGAHPKDEKATSLALIKLGKSIEKMSDIINTSAERECFRSPKGIKGTPCMNAYVERLNFTYGATSFEYLEQMVFIRYTGIHYNRVAGEFPKGGYAPEAAYLALTKNLIGHPDQVLPRIKEYMTKYKDGEWARKGILLWARLNEDIWWIHRKWSWVLYNWQISPEELIVKAEPYRQEGLKTFEMLIKNYGNTEEGRIAKKEYELLKVYQDDGRLYGIVNEASVEGTKAAPGHGLVE